MNRHKSSLIRYGFFITMLGLMMGTVGIDPSGSLKDLNVLTPSPVGSAGSLLSNVTLDGVINAEEWSNATYVDDFYLDIDNTPDFNGQSNVDGINTIYLGEDASNFYVALDLCSDRSMNGSGEWLGLWLNLNESVFTDDHEWASALNHSAESLIHDVENDQPWEFMGDEIDSNYLYLSYNGNYTLVEGSSNDTESNFENWTPPYKVVSEYTGGAYTYRIDFEIDLTTEFTAALIAEFLPHFEDACFRLRVTPNSTLATNELIAWYPDGSLNASDPGQAIDIPRVPNTLYYTVPYGLGNISPDHKVRFSMTGTSPSPFQVNITSLSLDIVGLSPNYLDPVEYPYSSIKTYTLTKGFAPSQRCSEDHRMFEICIPKTELEQYRGAGNLDIMVGGYGTMAFVGSNYWVYAASNPPEEKAITEYMYPLAQPRGVPPKVPARLPFRYAVVVSQIHDMIDDAVMVDKCNEMIRRATPRADAERIDSASLKKELQKALYWVQHYAPDQYKFHVSKTLPVDIKNKLTPEDKHAMRRVKDIIESGKYTDEQDLQNAMFSLAKDELNIKPARIFQALYQVFLGTKSGPRLGPFLLALDLKFVLSRLDEAIAP